MKRLFRQQGGTLLGFLLGLLVGLGISLAVAVYVTKVPIPLMDKGVQRKPDQEAIEAERNKTWNPNAALAPKPAASSAPAAPAAPAPAEPATPATPAKPAAQTTAAPATPAPAKNPADPLGELIQSRTKGPTPVTPVEVSTADPFLYFVQVGAFRTPADAETQRARLAMLGFDAKISEKEQGGKPVFRVRLGPYDQKDLADAALQRLNAQGVESALVRVQR